MIADALEKLPIVAILRGIKPQEAAGIAAVLYENGLRCIEVPLNSPSPFDSIRILADELPADCLVGAGTVLSGDDVRRVRDAGGKLIVTPNTFDEVITTALDADMYPMPGIATPTDAFNAIRLGARYLKLFPASTYGPGHIRAMRAVLPQDVSVLAVGGIAPDDFAEWRAAGTAGFGIGSELYRAGDSAAAVKTKVGAIVAAMLTAIEAGN